MKAVALDTQRKYLTIDAHTTRRLVPQRYPMLLLDYVKAYYYEKSCCVGVKVVSQSDPVLVGHFPDFPIYPGVLIIEALAQNSGMLVSLLTMQAERASIDAVVQMLASLRDGASLGISNMMVLVESKIKHTEPVYPGSTMELESSLVLQREGMYVCKVRALVEGHEVTKGQLSLAKMPASMLTQLGGGIS